MRLLLLAAAVVAAATEPAVLLVLRALCPARDPAAFAPRLASTSTVRLLTYTQTCGAEWGASVTRATLAALGEGGAVAVVGQVGAATCDALDAAAYALRRAPPEACALGAARAAAVARLAAHFGWRRTLLPPPTPPGSTECGAALGHVTRALAAAGLSTIQPKASFDATTLFPYVVILCASREAGVEVGALGQHVVRGAATVLLLHVDEPHVPSPAAFINDAFLMSNIDLVDNKHYRSKVKRTPSCTSDVSRTIRQRRKRPDELTPTAPPLAYTRNSPSAVKLLNISNETKTTARRRRRRSVLENRRPDYLFAKIDESNLHGDLLLLTDDDAGGDSLTDYDSVVKKALETIDRIVIAERTRTQLVKCMFHVYRRSTEQSPQRWDRVGIADTDSTRSLDESREWRTRVVLSNLTDALRRGGAEPGVEGDESEEASSTGGGGVWAGASLALGGAAGAALGGRWAAARRRRARRAADVVLVTGDFTFPADERRVGDGMETMLSCWLQQLHEFGGPELDRPDLLPRALVAPLPAPPPPAPPRPPSAPSSTCSVNRIALDRRTRYKGDPVHLKYLQIPDSLELKRKAIDVLLVMQSLRHDNLNPFIGWVSSPRAALVFEEAGRGSLEDVLRADEIKLDWTFRLSLLSDLVKGMRYLHASPLRVHGRLSSRNCVVDSRWVLRLTDYGLPGFHRAQPSTVPLPHRSAHELLWTAPELLRDPAAAARGSQPGDVFAFAIIMQEVIVRGEPYCMLALTPEEIVEKVSHPPPLIRPSVSMGAAPPEAVSVMRQCWSEAPDARPDFHRLHDIFRHLHRGRKINIVDSMFEMLEKYSNNLEELIKERTEQLDMEKKKTEQLLNRMLPRSVAERLLLGSRVEPEEFEEVSIYFSDIVGFTALAARSTPVQVVDLLNDLYTTFDAAIEQYRVYKVETIGDAYMVVGGLPARTRDHAESVATMALHLLHLAGRFRIRHLPETPLHLRIGLHTGPCCAAVVGLTMPRYCLFGDTVNTASRMESTGAAWRVQVSAATAARLLAAGDYRLRSRGLTQIKGKGAMHTYWLLGKDGFDKPLPTPPPLPSEEVLFETDGENDSEASSSGAGAGPSSPPAPTPAPAWRSGAVSADSSPPAAPRARLAAATSMDRYRFAGGAGSGGGRVLRRQWSLERGEALAAAAAGDAPCAAGEGAAPLALLAPPSLRPPHPRYRTRPGPPPPPPP